MSGKLTAYNLINDWMDCFTILSTFPEVKPRDLVFQRPIISELFRESGYIYLYVYTHKKKKSKQFYPWNYGDVLLY